MKVNAAAEPSRTTAPEPAWERPWQASSSGCTLVGLVAVVALGVGAGLVGTVLARRIHA